MSSRYRARILARQHPSGTGMMSRDAPSRALCERMIIMTAPLSMHSSGSPGSWPPSGVYIRCLVQMYTCIKKLASFFRNPVTYLFMASWTFLTVHARVLLCVAHDPGVRLRDIAASLDITERSAFGIITDLAEAGYVVKE
jgi:hypothetical protein